MPHLAEETTFNPVADELLALEADPPFTDGSCDWGSDPMEILMAKQERERETLEYFLSSPRH